LFLKFTAFETPITGLAVLALVAVPGALEAGAVEGVFGGGAGWGEVAFPSY